MDLDVILTPAALSADALTGRHVVVVDVLRASSTIVTALANGARAVIPVADQGTLGRLAATLDPDVSLLGGERGGRPLSGYGAGNSPLEYTREAVEGRTVVLSTSNGTRTMTMALAAREAAIGSFLNATVAAGFLSRALGAGRPATILCAGAGGRISLEDTLCAGLLVERVATAEQVARLGDAAQVAFALYRGSRAQLARALFGATHTQELIALGYADDVTYCARIDATTALPVFRDNRLVLETPGAA